MPRFQAADQLAGRLWASQLLGLSGGPDGVHLRRRASLQELLFLSFWPSQCRAVVFGHRIADQHGLRAVYFNTAHPHACAPPPPLLESTFQAQARAGRVRGGGLPPRLFCSCCCRCCCCSPPELALELELELALELELELEQQLQLLR